MKFFWSVPISRPFGRLTGVIAEWFRTDDGSYECTWRGCTDLYGPR
jgi:hypothetical protein